MPTSVRILQGLLSQIVAGAVWLSCPHRFFCPVCAGVFLVLRRGRSETWEA